MKKLFLLLLIVCFSTLTRGMDHTFSFAETKKTVRNFLVDNPKTVSALTVGAMITLYLAYGVINPWGPKPELKMEDFFNINK